MDWYLVGLIWCSWTRPIPFRRMLFTDCQIDEWQFVKCCFAECWFAECRIAKCHFTECRFTECRSRNDDSPNTNSLKWRRRTLTILTKTGMRSCLAISDLQEKFCISRASRMFSSFIFAAAYIQPNARVHTYVCKFKQLLLTPAKAASCISFVFWALVANVSWQSDDERTY